MFFFTVHTRQDMHTPTYPDIQHTPDMHPHTSGHAHTHTDTHTRTRELEGLI